MRVQNVPVEISGYGDDAFVLKEKRPIIIDKKNARIKHNAPNNHSIFRTKTIITQIINTTNKTTGKPKTQEQQRAQKCSFYVEKGWLKSEKENQKEMLCGPFRKQLQNKERYVRDLWDQL